MSVESYIWKDRRLSNDRTEKQVAYKLIDMDEYSLNKAYEHCKNMLYNQDVANPGRMTVLDIINEQFNYCRAELALRWFTSLQDKDGNLVYSKQSLLSDIRAWLLSVPPCEDGSYTLQDFLSVPPDFKTVTIDSLMKLCRETAPLFDHSKITIGFICDLGIYFTQRELKDLDNYTVGHTLEEKLDVVKTQLRLKDDVKIRINPSGLTEQEFRDIIHLKKMNRFKRCKYSELTTSQLETLTKKVLYHFEDKVLFQIKVWKNLMSQIEEVAAYKNYKLY